MNPNSTSRPISFSFLVQIILIANSFIMLYPVVVMVFSAFKGTAEIFEHPFAVPDFTQVQNFSRVLGETSMPTYFVNSIVVTGISIVLIIVLGPWRGTRSPGTSCAPIRSSCCSFWPGSCCR